MSLYSEAPAPFRDNNIPESLTHYIDELEKWATTNKRDSRNDTIKFWAFKVPAILASAGAGALAHFQLTTVSVIAGSVASVCVLVDGIHPRGMLRNTHLRACHDIRNLSNKVINQWRTRRRRASDETIEREIISGAEKERQRIAEYIREAETALRFEQSTREN